MQRIEKQDIYTRVTNQIVSHLEKGVRPWVRPWNAEHAAGRITRPLRHNGKPYSGINVFLLWLASEANGWSSGKFAIMASKPRASRPRANACARRSLK